MRRASEGSSLLSALCRSLAQRLQACGSLATPQRCSRLMHLQNREVDGIIEGAELRNAPPAKAVFDSLQIFQRAETGVNIFVREQKIYVRKFHIFKDSKMPTM